MALLLEQQKEFDRQHNGQQYWEFTSWQTKATRQIGQHVARASLIVYEGERDRIVSDALPRLSVCRARLINAHHLPAEEIEANDRRTAGVQGIRSELLAANCLLGMYPAEVGEDFTTEEAQGIIPWATDHLHVATESLAAFYKVDVEEAHLRFLKEHSDPAPAI